MAFLEFCSYSYSAWFWPLFCLCLLVGCSTVALQLFQELSLWVQVSSFLHKINKEVFALSEFDPNLEWYMWFFPPLFLSKDTPWKVMRENGWKLIQPLGRYTLLPFWTEKHKKCTQWRLLHQSKVSDETTIYIHTEEFPVLTLLWGIIISTVTKPMKSTGTCNIYRIYILWCILRSIYFLRI